MSYYIGGHSCGNLVDQKYLDCREARIPISHGKSIGFQRNSESYVRTKISFNGEVKTFYILDGEQPIKHRESILKLWEMVKTDIYTI